MFFYRKKNLELSFYADVHYEACVIINIVLHVILMSHGYEKFAFFPSHSLCEEN